MLSALLEQSQGRVDGRVRRVILARRDELETSASTLDARSAVMTIVHVLDDDPDSRVARRFAASEPRQFSTLVVTRPSSAQTLVRRRAHPDAWPSLPNPVPNAPDTAMDVLMHWVVPHLLFPPADSVDLLHLQVWPGVRERWPELVPLSILMALLHHRPLRLERMRLGETPSTLMHVDPAAVERLLEQDGQPLLCLAIISLAWIEAQRGEPPVSVWQALCNADPFHINQTLAQATLATADGGWDGIEFPVLRYRARYGPYLPPASIAAHDDRPVPLYLTTSSTELPPTSPRVSAPASLLTGAMTQLYHLLYAPFYTLPPDLTERVHAASLRQRIDRFVHSQPAQ